ncbi:MAG: ribosome silencing factor [Eubacteriales bacterium]|nr:ribosome silencing factor [Eubacteriales bacterium]
MEQKQLIEKIASILYEKKAQDIVALDVTGLTVITDAMVIASGRNTLQVKALADELEDKLSELGMDVRRKEGQQSGHWIVLDYGTVLVHLFHTQEREFYRLDKLWEHDGNFIPLPFENSDD